MTRAGRQVGSFLSALGGVRETRLTATLAYLIAQFPEEFLPLVCGARKGRFTVSVEETDEGDRYDVLIKGDGFPIILEGKLGARQNHRQLRRYVRTVRTKYKRRPGLVIVDVGSHGAQGFSGAADALKEDVKWTRYRTWDDVAGVCRGIVRHKRPFTESPVAAAVAQDLLAHLEENAMTTDERLEIYLRDMSTSDSVQLYFRYGIYRSGAEYFRSAKNNLYFAPYFTKATVEELSDDNLVPVGEGISYLSKIEEVQVLPKRKVLAFLKDRGVEDAVAAAKLVCRARRHELLVLLLGEPRLLFASPVTKEKLNKHMRFGRGAMGSRSCSLDDLLAASKL